MTEKRFKLSKYVTPSSVSNFCDENGRMLNKEVVKVLNEQQATIRKLQDLCGKSDGENAKLRIENVQLQKENEQLKQGFNELLAVHTKVMQTLDDEFVSKALADDNGDGV